MNYNFATLTSYTYTGCQGMPDYRVNIVKQFKANGRDLEKGEIARDNLMKQIGHEEVVEVAHSVSNDDCSFIILRLHSEDKHTPTATFQWNTQCHKNIDWGEVYTSIQKVFVQMDAEDLGGLKCI